MATNVVKAGFIVLDANTGVVTRVIWFQYNPETLVRRLDAATPTAGAGVPIAGVGAAPPGLGSLAGNATSGVSAVAVAAATNLAVAAPSPAETVSFTISIDAAEKLERGDSVAQQAGVYPLVSALEMLLYPTTPTLLIWVSGSKRIVPVRIVLLVFNEQAFDAALNPVRVEASVQLHVLKDAELPANSKGRALWDAHLKVLQQLAAEIDTVTLAQMGLSGV
jgi:hypothetical protein